MRLIVSVDSLRPPLTGIGRYTWELVSRLQQVADLRQLRFFRNNQWVTDPTRLPAAETSLQPVVEAAGSPQERAAPPWVRWARALYWDTTCRFNVFHSPNYFLPSFARNGVVTVHDLSVFKYPQTHPAARLRQFEQSFHATLSIASQLITDSESVRQEVIEMFGWPAGRITAVPLGVSTDYRPRDAAELQPALARYRLRHGHYALCVSTVEPRKRVGALLAAYRRLPLELRDTYPLVLVGGRGWESDDEHRQIDTAVAEGWLIYAGFVEAADMPMLYAGAGLFVYPSIYEGFGLPVAEAMASGVPVLTSNRSCLPEVAAGAARLFDPDDIEALTSALEQGLLDEQWRIKAASDGLRVAAGYTWDRCVEQTLAVYRAASS